jgi:hypothetical protein
MVRSARRATQTQPFVLHIFQLGVRLDRTYLDKLKPTVTVSTRWGSPFNSNGE